MYRKFSNYLFARQHGGDLIFRIEDTDSNRFVPGAEEYIIEQPSLFYNYNSYILHFPALSKKHLMTTKESL